MKGNNKFKQTIVVPQEGIGYLDTDKHSGYTLATFGCGPCVGLAMFIGTLRLVFHVSSRRTFWALRGRLQGFLMRAKDLFPNHTLRARLIGNNKFEGAYVNDDIMNETIQIINRDWNGKIELENRCRMGEGSVWIGDNEIVPYQMTGMETIDYDRIMLNFWNGQVSEVANWYNIDQQYVVSHNKVYCCYTDGLYANFGYGMMLADFNGANFEICSNSAVATSVTHIGRLRMHEIEIIIRNLKLTDELKTQNQKKNNYEWKFKRRNRVRNNWQFKKMPRNYPKRSKFHHFK